MNLSDKGTLRQFFSHYKRDSRCLLIEDRKRMNESACFTHVHIHAYPLLVGRPGNKRRIRELESIYRIYTAGVTLLPNRPRSVQSNFMICIHLASRAPDLPLVVPVIVLFSLFFCSVTPPLLLYALSKKGRVTSKVNNQYPCTKCF